MSRTLSQPQQRINESLKSQFRYENVDTADVVLALSCDDEGVERNGGRIGSRYAPRAILNQLGKCTIAQDPPSTLGILELLNEYDCLDFESKTTIQIEKLQNIKGKKIIHIGGGHDHIYPLAKAFFGQKLSVLNLDAHADTRTDLISHSGNPFRRLSMDQHLSHLYQWGLHPYTNSMTTLSQLPHTKQEILLSSERLNLSKKELFLKSLENNSLGTTLIFSLDCDVLNSSFMSGVSAVNHHGVALEEIFDLVSWYKLFCKKNNQKEIYGIYEYNPVFDDLSSRGARAIVSIIWEMLK